MAITFEKGKKFFGIHVSAIFEILLFLTVLVLGNLLFGDGKRFINYHLHPFWIIILLVTVQYGTSEGILAVILSTLFLYVGNVPVQKAQESFFDYQFNLGFLPLMWFATAFILGSLRQRMQFEKEELEAEYLHAQEKVDKITEEYEVLKEMNENLEIHLTSQAETSATSFKVFSALEKLDPGKVILGLQPVIETALNPQKFSVFAYGSQGLEAVTSSGWEPSDKYKRRFGPSTPLYKAIVNDRHLLSIVNKEDQKILEKEGVLASPLIDPLTNEVFGMIKVEKIDFLSLNLSRIETFKIVCELIGQAYANAKKHETVEKESMYSLGKKDLFGQNFYLVRKQYLMTLAEKYSFAVTAIFIKLGPSHVIEESWLKNFLHVLPEESVNCSGKRPEKEMIILFPSKTSKEGEELKEKIFQWFKEQGWENDVTIEIEYIKKI